MQASAPVDIVIASAGLGSAADLIETSEESWNRPISVNLTTVFSTVQLAAHLMAPRLRGPVGLHASPASLQARVLDDTFSPISMRKSTGSRSFSAISPASRTSSFQA